jgi:membrane-bound metal-dependent hydrolase YbcI (DUF457 family)
VIAGHFGFAAAIKSREPQVPLWALMLACVWLDIVFVPLFVAHIETITNAAGTNDGYGSAIIHADYTHSLVGALILSALFGIAAAFRWTRRTAIVLAVVVFSHWVLDLVVHRADLPVLINNAGNLPHFGFGLWRYPVAAMLTELIIIAGGAFLYWRAARESVATGSASFQKRAQLSGLLVLVSGLAVLALDFTRILD